MARRFPSSRTRTRQRDLLRPDAPLAAHGAGHRAQRPLHMPPRAATNVPQLTDAQLDTLRAWFRACTPPEPEGMGCDKGELQR